MTWGTSAIIDRHLQLKLASTIPSPRMWTTIYSGLAFSIRHRKRWPTLEITHDRL
jgi:hypothetical protein